MQISKDLFLLLLNAHLLAAQFNDVWLLLPPYLIRALQSSTYGLLSDI